MCAPAKSAPFLFKAVEVDGEDYWDGGYMGNPALFPLFSNKKQHDILIVHINPIERPDIPKKAADIENRINEISFNATLLREMRAIDFVQRLIEDDIMPASKMRVPYIHSISDDATMTQLGVATKLAATPGLVDQLFTAGRGAMDHFLTNHRDDLGKRSSCNLRTMFE
jgi:NTE family protein